MLNYDNFKDGLFKTEHDLASVTQRQEIREASSDIDRIIFPA